MECRDDRCGLGGFFFILLFLFWFFEDFFVVEFGELFGAGAWGISTEEKGSFNDLSVDHRLVR